MIRIVVALLSGFVFAVGLGLAGMTRPAKVIGFLDLFGRWDPSLAFVMGGAIAVHSLAYLLARRRPAPLFEDRFCLPASASIDSRLVVGAALFGVGWGIAGYCPGPAVTSLASGSAGVAILVGAMLVGTMIARMAERATTHSDAATAAASLEREMHPEAN